MRIIDFGISLERLSLETIEILRNWRNNPKIRAHMFYQKEISEEAQRDWFKTIDNDFNHYWIIYDRQKRVEVGMIHSSQINPLKGEAHVGLFIYDEDWYGTQLPVYASLAMLEFNFKVLKLKKLFAKVKSDNEIALDYNRSLGFKVAEELDSGGLLLELDKDSYESAMGQLLDFTNNKKDNQGQIIVEEADSESLPELVQYFEENHERIPYSIVLPISSKQEEPIETQSRQEA